MRSLYSQHVKHELNILEDLTFPSLFEHDLKNIFHDGAQKSNSLPRKINKNDNSIEGTPYKLRIPVIWEVFPKITSPTLKKKKRNRGSPNFECEMFKSAGEDRVSNAFSTIVRRHLMNSCMKLKKITFSKNSTKVLKNILLCLLHLWVCMDAAG